MAEAHHITERRNQDRQRARMRLMDKELQDQGLPIHYLYDWTISQGTEDMAAKPRGRKAQVSTQALKLAEALAFINVASRDTGEVYQQHAVLYGKWAYRFDGIISAGHPIEEELSCAPHAERLYEAITKCGASLAIAELDTGRLSIKGDKLRALVPCLELAVMPAIAPDPQCAVINADVLKALEVVGVLATENAATVVEASVMLQANTALATNMRIAIECWHGVHLPPNMLLPKLFVTAVSKCGKVPVGFGFNDGEHPTVTFYFEDGAWIKSISYTDPYPGISELLSQPSYPIDVPPSLFEGVAIVSPFNKFGHVTFGAGKVMSHHSEEIGAQFDVEGLPAGKQFDGKLLKKIAPHVKKMDLTTYTDRAFFYCDETVRGLIMAVTSHEPDVTA